MTTSRRHRLTLALLVSVLLHLALLGAPGWQVPTLDDLLSSGNALDTPQQVRLDAHLTPSRSVAATVVQPPRAAVRQPARPPRSATTMPAAPGVIALPATEIASAAATEMPAPAEPERAVPTALPVVAAAEVDSHAATPAATASATPTEPALPRRGSIRFAVSRGDKGFVVGQSVHRWSHDGKTYTLTSLTETTGVAALFKSVRVVWTSEGEIGVGGLRPHEFHTEKDGNRGDAASFNWTTAKLALSGGPQREVALVPGAQDMLSMFYQLSAMSPVLSHEQSEFFVTTGRKLERYAFAVLGEEKLATRYGGQRTLHVRTLAGDQTIDVWLAFELRGLPVKIRYTDGKGDSFDQNAEDIEYEGMPGAMQRH